MPVAKSSPAPGSSSVGAQLIEALMEVLRRTAGGSASPSGPTASPRAAGPPTGALAWEAMSPEDRLSAASGVMASRMPGEYAATRTIQPMSRLEATVYHVYHRLTGTPPPMGATNLLRQVSVHPGVLENLDQDELERVLAHELTHVAQIQRRGVPQMALDLIWNARLPYEQRPHEQEAMAGARSQRGARRSDLQLLPETPEGWDVLFGKKPLER